MSSESIHEFTDGNFNDEVLQSTEPVLVDFWAPWCQPCTMLAPLLEEIADDYAGRAKIGKVDIDTNREVPMQFGVASIPTVILFKDGEPRKTLVGLSNKDAYQDALDELL